MCGVAARRKAEELVLAGKVAVNGRTITDLATRVTPGTDRVTVQGRPVSPRERKVYIVLNKPKDTITTVHDEKGRGTVMNLIATSERIFPVGRLDRNTTGVLLLTNDGELANRLMHPRFGVRKSYRVTCDTPVRQEHLRQLAHGVEIDGVQTAPAQVVVLPGAKGREIGITIHEGRNRQVRNMFESLGYAVEKLDRVAYGPITREGLSRGESRSLTRREVDELYRLAGMEREW
ncbi:MAG: pseudouridine synthase [Bacteroidetes bacterium]|nr:pseudouridine synthase [Bacteroidota bacterium]